MYANESRQCVSNMNGNPVNSLGCGRHITITKTNILWYILHAYMFIHYI